MIYLLIDLGIRRGELIGLCREDFDFNIGTVIIHHNIQYESKIGIYDDTPKGKRNRCISMSEEVSEHIKEYIEQIDNIAIEMYGSYDAFRSMNPNGYIFTQDDMCTPMHPSSLNSWMVKFEAQNNLPHIHPHKFRHSQASILYAANVDDLTISRRLGHAQVSTTQNIYSHLLAGQDKKASNALSALLYDK